MRQTQLSAAVTIVVATTTVSAVAQTPDAATTTAIAEEAFIYGFPMVMGYGVMYEYAIDSTAKEYKAPFNQIFNTARVYTADDRAVIMPNSDTPHSFVWADLRAEPIVIHVPGGSRIGTSRSSSFIFMIAGRHTAAQ